MRIYGSNLKYIPPAIAYDTGYASFTFKVSDGALDSEADYTMTINVDEVPTLTNRRRVWQQTLTVGRHAVGSELIGYGWFLDTGTLTAQREPIDLGTNRYRVGETNPDAGLTATEKAGQDDNGQSLGAGVYLYRLVAGDKQRHGKVALIR